MLTCDFTGGTSGKESACWFRRLRRCGFSPWVRNLPQRRAWKPIPVFLPGESQRQRSLVGLSIGTQRIGYEWSSLTCMYYAYTFLSLITFQISCFSEWNLVWEYIGENAIPYAILYNVYRNFWWAIDGKKEREVHLYYS